ncbi:ArpU family phage packaging/lysis transcriptional regulator [Bacillus capparidis]|uniref:ArpU family phage transcriptional regulator n=1 Tax=Bacillus capparidis TaxID=1840411 RepID=A0ABS4D1I2_9BACI|nr:ArpU family phage packaging/lysis transcriptional regulator [Bacillus capparidis]MBP1083489.1 ArpU family phage transcriptional regulator [Bacillus capparidis]MED1094690.1 ArpU family phage packaging/lysis transcriptional regulator [Bacillus capparidis]
MIVKQSSFFPDIDEKRIRSLVVQELRQYVALKVQIENLKEQKEAGTTNLFPEFRRIKINNNLKVKQVDRALNCGLDEEERKIIELKYLSLKHLNDIDIYLELGLKKGKYYEKKRAAIFRLATALGII